MGNNNLENNETTQPVGNMQWGAHNPNLKDENFIDRKPKKISAPNELLADVDEANAASQVEEAGRDRPGTKEGEHNERIY